MSRTHREAFGQRHAEMQGALKKLGSHPWNLLHHPKRKELLANLADKVEALKKAGNDFDTAVKPATIKPKQPTEKSQKPKQSTDKKD